MHTAAQQHTWHKLLAAACAVVCCCASWYAARAGASRLLSESALRLHATEYEGETLPLATEAVRLSASDPEAHYALASAYAQRGEDVATVKSLERAVSLRPLYYLTWLKLGRARERAGDVDGAVAALSESIRLAPFYAEPRWQLGNALLRSGTNPGAAFAELRRAVSSRPALFGYTVELAWRSYHGDIASVVHVTAPRDAAEHVTLARFLVRHGESASASELYRVVRDDVSADARRALVADMIAAGKFHEAHEVWADGKRAGGAEGEKQIGQAVGVTIFNGDFESQTNADAPGFDWRFARDQQFVTFSLDQTAPHAGARSLLLNFNGAGDTNARLASQLVSVESGARYRLSFAARSENLVSGGMPLVSLSNANGNKILTQTESLPRNTGGWREYALEFAVPDEAFLLVIRRANCVESVCPIFGRAWFDDFSLKKL